MDVKISIIGAGIVGLSIAAKLSSVYPNEEIFVLEKNEKIGMETSSRNSEVIHSGVYYPNNSLKAKLCVEGRKLMYAYCKKHAIGHEQCGKFIVAKNQSESERLAAILKNAQNNGVDDAILVEQDFIKEKEPHIIAEKGIWFPSSGIVNTHELMKQLETDAVNNNCQFAYCSEVIAIDRIENGYEIHIEEEGGDHFSFTSEYIINASGLQSDLISEKAGITRKDYQLYYWKGEYFAVGNSKNKYINRLIYPLPPLHGMGLGVHATIDLSGGMKLGPNTIFIPEKTLDYSVDEAHKQEFYTSAKSIFPFLELDDLHRDQAGIRPKLQGVNDPFRDFIIKNEKENGHPNLINLIGIESPGLTSCLAIANYINEIITL